MAGAITNTPPLRLPAAQTAGGLQEAARNFEAMAIGALLRPMFDTIDSADSAFGGGAAENAWRPMLVDAFAHKAALSGGLGLASSVYAVLLHQSGMEGKADDPV